MKNKAGNLAVLSSHKIEKKTALGDHQSYHEMLLALQTTLDIEQLLGLFSEHFKTIVPHSGFGFRNEKLGIELSMGKKGRHACIYNLELENEPLGEWRMSRDQRFSELDLVRIEALLCRLLYPLRNGLRYREALCYAHTDQLTQTGNRAALLNALQRELELARRYGTPLSIILFDIDHFKSINDSFGHDAGDAVLRSVARSIKDTVRGSDILFRYGGEEFVILLSNTPKDGAVNLAERIRSTVETLSCGIGDMTLRVTLSLGVATLIPAETHLDLLRRADQVMYTAKRGGRNQVAVASEE
ncbi:GGDEF domain-containing protein [Methylocaldum sp.]|uniref:GGDEF domain-containing protein n=1 Tax=Methylocaldum sp. TaxID=1969727 RepID=UPI002D6372AA|nr:GGDEF domain-containing protein [Methylocaldum sp.]HYE34226.1 GGDEF domain-containing protein [Methylocaldum sp.]